MQHLVRVLLVESDLATQHLLQGALGEAQNLRPRFVVAGSMPEAIISLGTDTPDVVLLGPHAASDAASVAPVIKAANSAPVIVVRGGPTDSEQWIGMGAHDVLEASTLDPRLLERTILNATARAAWARALSERAVTLEARNRELDAFAHVAGHDMKAPLRAVNYLLQDAKSKLDDPDAAAQLLERAGERVVALFSMIDDLLAAARVGQHAAEPALDPVAIAREAVGRLQVPPGFRILLPPRANPVGGSATDLGQVMQNLVANALQHHDRDTGMVAISLHASGGMMEFTVADDGPGIPANARDRIFQEFSTFGAPTAGAGVGLARARHVIQAHGGSIWLGAQAERGARFHFTWPLAGGAAP